MCSAKAQKKGPLLAGKARHVAAWIAAREKGRKDIREKANSAE
jgi:hypothetical protein